MNYYPAIEKCYYVTILLKISVGATKIIYNESFKDNDSSFAM